MEEQSLKKVMYALIAVAVLLAGGLVKELTIEKEELTEQMVALQNDYATLSSDYDDINLQLDSSRLEVQMLIEKITKTEATNRSKIRQYEKELGTLRSIMRNYIVQIDSLNTLNKQLTADAAAARREAAESRRRSEQLTKTVASLSGQVAAGSVLKARGISCRVPLAISIIAGHLLAGLLEQFDTQFQFTTTMGKSAYGISLFAFVYYLIVLMPGLCVCLFMHGAWKNTLHRLGNIAEMLLYLLLTGSLLWLCVMLCVNPFEK